MALHENRMIRLPLRRRQVHVHSSQLLTPHMQRIVVTGADLADFHSPSADDHIKLFFPNSQGEFVLPQLGENGIVWPQNAEPSPARDYTPRHFDAEKQQLVLDFVLHGHGVASSWAKNAQPGDVLFIGGPRGSRLLANDYANYVLIGDETALPAIARRLEELPASAHSEVLIEVPDARDCQKLTTATQMSITWLYRNGTDAANSTLLEKVLSNLPPLQGDTFYWIACESARARNMRLFLQEQKHVNKEWIHATGYWKAREDDNESG